MENALVEILLVEDNLNDAEMTLRALKRGNVSANVTHLRDGALALDFLYGTGKYSGRDISNKPRVIFLDLKMPRLNGLELLERIKQDEDKAQIPIVVLTSSKEPNDVERAYTLGVNSYVVKPVDVTGFVKTVADLGQYWVNTNQTV